MLLLFLIGMRNTGPGSKLNSEISGEIVNYLNSEEYFMLIGNIGINETRKL